MPLHLSSTGSGSEGMDSGIILEQALTVILRPNSQRASTGNASDKPNQAGLLVQFLGNKAVSDIIEKIHVSPSKDKVSPGMMEVALKLPCRVKSASLTIEFDKEKSPVLSYTEVFSVPLTTPE
ncbi:hypothetical protein PTKIN_Ptkin15bG0150500 [Pterospermum kingtungense]